MKTPVLVRHDPEVFEVSARLAYAPLGESTLWKDSVLSY